jgi:hypothetical protein
VGGSQADDPLGVGKKPDVDDDEGPKKPVVGDN